MFSISGFRMHISGRTGTSLVFINANQLCLNAEFENYIKKIVKYLARKIKSKTTIELNEKDGISREENLLLYTEFINKVKNTIYLTEFESKIDTHESGKELFSALDIENQVDILEKFLQVFQCNSSFSNLQKIGGQATVGRIVPSMNISSEKETFIIHQSTTGLFEQIIDLHTV